MAALKGSATPQNEFNYHGMVHRPPTGATEADGRKGPTRDDNDSKRQTKQPPGKKRHLSRAHQDQRGTGKAPLIPPPTTISHAPGQRQRRVGAGAGYGSKNTTPSQRAFCRVAAARRPEPSPDSTGHLGQESHRIKTPGQARAVALARKHPAQGPPDRA